MLAPVACKRQELTPEQARLQKGRTLYSLHCASCHHPSFPERDGALGPAVAGTSLDLLEARVVRGSYPEGYTPKRSTWVMPKMPLVRGDIEALHAYLNSP
jgi:mono/diheme cytochrome c family protein